MAKRRSGSGKTAVSTGRWRRLTLLAAVVVAVVALLYTTVPIAVTVSRGDEDSRVTLVGRFGYYLDPTVLTLDLWALRDATTLDLTRVLFRVAASRQGWPPVRHVTLSRRSRPVFILPGDDFAELGRLLEAGENPDDLMRTLPQRLYRPSGEQAFRSSQGRGAGRQMVDLADFGESWALGTD